MPDIGVLNEIPNGYILRMVSHPRNWVYVICNYLYEEKIFFFKGKAQVHVHCVHFGDYTLHETLLVVVTHH